MNIVALGTSTSKHSINQKLATYVAGELGDHQVRILDLNDYEMPIYSFDRQQAGFPEQAQAFLEEIKAADGVVISLAEHNLNFTTAFKNVLDWVSRIDMQFLLGKKLLVLSTSPGGFGGGNVMEIGLKYFGFAGGEVVAHYSLPSFQDNFQEGVIVNEEIQAIVAEKIDLFLNSLVATEATVA